MHSLAVLTGYDTWRGVADGSWQNNGINTGLNYGTRLGQFSEWTGIGFQVGGSVGVYDWSGTDYRYTNQDVAETQGFLTYGFFRNVTDGVPVRFALVHDWMFNDTFSVFGQSPTLNQMRGQVGYVWNDANEFGVWGAWRGGGDTINVPGEGPVTWRPLNQVNAFWHHKWSPGGADTSIWVGVPENQRLDGGGSLGDYLAGALANVPLSDRVALYTLVTYLHPSASPGPIGSLDEAWNFSIGVSFYPVGNTRSRTVSGQCWAPQMSVANNGYFLVDASENY